jgi:hypothetical protein
MSIPTPFESEMLQMMRAMQSDIWELKSDVSVLKSDVWTLKQDVSVLKSDMIEVKGRLHHMEVWNNKAFEAIEGLTEEVQREGAATRTMMYQSSNDMFQLRDRLDVTSRSHMTKPRSRGIPV